MARRRYRRRYRRRAGRIRRSRRSNRSVVPGRPITRMRISSNPRPVIQSQDCGHRRTIGFEQLIDLTAAGDTGIFSLTWANIADRLAPAARTADMPIMLRWIQAWSGIPNGGTIFGYLYQLNCMNLQQYTDTSAAPATSVTAQYDSGSASSMPRIGFKIPWTSRRILTLDNTNKALNVAHFTHYGPVQTDAAKTKYYIYVRVGVTFFM